MQPIKRLLTVIGLGLTLAGCSDDVPQQEQTQTADTHRTVQHAMGETRAPKTPKRIVVLSTEATETLLALGIAPVGAVRSSTADPADTWFAHIREAMADVAVVGEEKQVNLEVVASLKPDLILGLKSRQEQIYPQLSAIAPTVFADQFHGALRENLMLMSDAVNRKPEGEQLLATLDQHIASLSTCLDEAGWLDQQVAVIRFQVTGARFYYNDSFAASLIKALGFDRPALHDTSGFAEPLTRERIPEADADVQFYFTFASADPVKGEQNARSWLDNPLWQSLQASQKGQIFQVNNDIWNKSYGILSAHKVLDDIEGLLLKADPSGAQG
ncbi:ABC transporter substrate-binding protein [Kistimonas asteriae]|uniref:ABC transporter substrate-binding protein n=1 Tax=Kistimonas asteriae TaxID=517724 RepID=UPI001BA7F8A4|nr:iron-siderophore ABC transporter substrate-binding protein [Kistimonas asteriae]